MRKYLLGKDTFFATVFTFLVIGLLGLSIINTSVFNPFVKAFKDFDFLNIYYSKIRNNQGTLDTNIVVVNIGHLKRDSLGLMIKKINEQNPRVIGFDVFLKERKDNYSDSVLRAALEQTKNLVVAGNPGSTGINKYFGNFKSAYININGENATSTARTFCPFTENSGSLDTSFSAKILSIASPDAFNKLTSRHKEIENIHYRGDYEKFRTFSEKEIFDSFYDLSVLKNKIVLLGYCGEANGSITDVEDAHFTPVNPSITGRSYPDMYGVYIHANIISMMLNEDYVDHLPLWLAWLLGFVLCYIHMAVFVYFYKERHKWFHLAGKSLQLITSVLLLWVEFLIYQYFNYKVDMLPAIATILLAVDIIYFYEGFVVFLSKKFGFNSLFLKH
jgi:CHASE2 domain-containing sensor protein